MLLAVEAVAEMELASGMDYLVVLVAAAEAQVVLPQMVVLEYQGKVILADLQRPQILHPTTVQWAEVVQVLPVLVAVLI